MIYRLSGRDPAQRLQVAIAASSPEPALNWVFLPQSPFCGKLLRQADPIGTRSGDMGAIPNCYAVGFSTGTGRSNSGLKNRLPMAAKTIGAKPITTA